MDASHRTVLTESQEAAIINLGVTGSISDRIRQWPQYFDTHGRPIHMPTRVRKEIMKRRKDMRQKRRLTAKRKTKEKTQSNRKTKGIMLAYDGSQGAAKGEDQWMGWDCDQCQRRGSKCDQFSVLDPIGVVCGKCLQMNEECSLAGTETNISESLQILQKSGSKRKQPPSQILPEPRDMRGKPTRALPTSLTPSRPLMSCIPDHLASPVIHEDTPAVAKVDFCHPSDKPTAREIMRPQSDMSKYVANAKELTEIITGSSTMQIIIPCNTDAVGSYDVEDILCSGEPCSRKSYTSEHLEKYCGIRLKDARYMKEQYGFWLCPECTERKKRTSGQGNLEDITAMNIRCEFGEEILKDEDICQMLHRFSALVLQYLNEAKDTRALGVSRSAPLLQLSCIRDEEVDSSNPSPLVSSLKNFFFLF
jgi:hypothetical protein